ncbi:MAG: hypothetical protein OXI87_09105 [Albidovulum sp.]|nr:hypothetical protein [Albidovulum sp.]
MLQRPLLQIPRLQHYGPRALGDRRQLHLVERQRGEVGYDVPTEAHYPQGLASCLYRLGTNTPVHFSLTADARVSIHPSSHVAEPSPRRWKDLFAGDPMASDLGIGVECRASDLPGAS